MHSTQLRREHIQGFMTGAAIGDALGYARQGLSRDQATKLFGAGPCQYEFSRNKGVTGFNTAQVLMTAQSIVSSRTEVELFKIALLRRLAWYAVSFPTDMAWSTRRIGLQSWFRWVTKPQRTEAQSSEPAIRSILLTMALHNTNLSSREWVRHSVRLTHSDATVLEGCRFISGLTKLIIANRGELSVLAVAKFLADTKWSHKLKDQLKLLSDSLNNNRKPQAVAQQLGWSSGIPATIVPAVIMSTYCFLRYTSEFTKAVDSVIRLGGDTSTTGALVGGLSGAFLGDKQLPKPLVSELPDRAYGPTWIGDMARRLADWPHGVDDLSTAPALQAAPIHILGGNLGRHFTHLIHSLRRTRSKVMHSGSMRMQNKTLRSVEQKD